jgi:hypothetical protein
MHGVIHEGQVAFVPRSDRLCVSIEPFSNQNDLWLLFGGFVEECSAKRS